MRRGRLDPEDWAKARKLGHRMLDDMFDSVEAIRSLPVWMPMPELVRATLHEPLPEGETDLSLVYDEYGAAIAPYATGNRHPRFFGWVHGNGTIGGTLAEMLAAGLNCNCAGRDHAGLEIERVVLEWWRDLFGFPAETSGLIVTGSSMANLIGVIVAKTTKLGVRTRSEGLRNAPMLRAYTSTALHSSVERAFDLAGLGTDSLRRIAVDRDRRVDAGAMRAAIAADRAAGDEPFLIVATAGAVDSGAIDDLSALADLAQAEKLWLHVDGAFGALLMLSEKLSPRLRGIERADSLAFDFHKWLHVPYDAGCILVRDGELHRAAFASHAPYLAATHGGLAAAQPWPVDFGPELSRGFRALKVWFTLKEHGTGKIARSIEENVRQAAFLGRLVVAHPALELLVPVQLNIVCFRYRPARETEAAHIDALNEAIVVALQESGVAAPSMTTIDGARAIRVNLTNHRCDDDDLELLVHEVCVRGEQLEEELRAQV